MPTVLVTGAAGFIGSWVADALAARGDRVVGIDNFNAYYDVGLKEARAKRLAGRCKIYRADLKDYRSVEKIFKNHKISQVCHLAAQAGVRYSLDNPFAYEESNLRGTLNLLELCRQKKVRSFIYASSSSVYGNNKKVPFSENDRVDEPISLYAATKKSCELMAYSYHHLFGIHTTGLRFFTVYGPWGRPDMAYFKFTEAIAQGKAIEIYNFGRMKRDFTYITDIVRGVLAALDKDYPCEIFNLGNSKPVNLLYFIHCLEKELKQKAVTKLLPMQPGDVSRTFADLKRSRRMLGFRPETPIEDGLHSFVRWYQEYRSGKKS